MNVKAFMLRKNKSGRVEHDTRTVSFVMSHEAQRRLPHNAVSSGSVARRFGCPSGSVARLGRKGGV